MKKYIQIGIRAGPASPVWLVWPYLDRLLMGEEWLAGILTCFCPLSTLSDLRGVYFNEGKATSYASVEACQYA